MIDTNLGFKTKSNSKENLSFMLDVGSIENHNCLVGTNN